MGFPPHDFGGQDPTLEHQIQDFCQLTYGVKFPMFETIPVRAHNTAPLSKTLARAVGGDYPTWNFHQYL
ncbi:MAG: hypothetical protein B7Z82_08545 [Halothiobacillus sp. 20-54-6]|nr:MAG: hypothetical protein B7Z82_08545 [Halothiobacillus sp. 20-54-6]